MENRSNTESGIEYASATDVGMRRPNNQDSLVISMSKSDEDWKRRGHLFMVADGMGAHAAGELASKMAVDGVSHRYRKYKDLPPHLALERALDETNAEVHRRGNANLDFRNMGTTASAMAILPQGAVLAHVGDSRVYRVRGTQIEQLTFDHSLVWELQANGRIGPGAEETASIPKNVITRSLGPSPEVQVDLEGPFPLMLGDTFLICSDGLSGQITDPEIGGIIANLPPAEAAQVLVDLANLRGGPDNITVIIARVVEQGVVDAARSAPVLRESATTSRSVNPAIWIVGLILLLAGIGLAFSVVAVGVIVATLGGLMLLGAAFRQLASPVSAASGMLGKGPYRAATCPASIESVDTLSGIVNDLREAAETQEWKVEWAPFNKLTKEATDAKTAGDPSAAFRALARAITFMMEELRLQDDRNSNDSAVDY